MSDKGFVLSVAIACAGVAAIEFSAMTIAKIAFQIGISDNTWQMITLGLIATTLSGVVFLMYLRKGEKPKCETKEEAVEEENKVPTRKPTNIELIEQKRIEMIENENKTETNAEQFRNQLFKSPSKTGHTNSEQDTEQIGFDDEKSLEQKVRTLRYKKIMEEIISGKIDVEPSEEDLKRLGFVRVAHDKRVEREKSLKLPKNVTKEDLDSLRKIIKEQEET